MLIHLSGTSFTYLLAMFSFNCFRVSAMRMFLVTCLLVTLLVSRVHGRIPHRLGRPWHTSAEMDTEREGRLRLGLYDPYPFDFRGFYWLSE